MLELTSDVKKTNFVIVQIGAGGNGGYLVRDIAQMANLSKINLSYVVADPDIVESHNLENQLFLENDVGLRKVDSLIQRYAGNYDIDISCPEYFKTHYVQDANDIQKLFEHGLDRLNNFDYQIVKILIGAVDNSFSRMIMHEFFTKESNLIWIDAGNDSVKFYNRDFYDENELAEFQEVVPNFKFNEENMKTGWQGQVVCGVKSYGEVLTNSYGEIFSQYLTKEDNPAEISCSVVVARSPQRVLTNQTSAHYMKTILVPIFFEGCLIHSYFLFHARSGQVKAQQV